MIQRFQQNLFLLHITYSTCRCDRFIKNNNAKILFLRHFRYYYIQLIISKDLTSTNVNVNMLERLSLRFVDRYNECRSNEILCLMKKYDIFLLHSLLLSLSFECKESRNINILILTLLKRISE